MDWAHVFAVVGVLVGLGSLGGVVLYSARTSYGKSSVEALQADVSNWKNRVGERDARIENLEAEAVRDKAAIKRLGKQNEDQQKQLADLREMVLQRAEFAQLVAATQAHEENAQRRADQRSREHATMLAQQQESLNAIAELADNDRKLTTVVHQIQKDTKS
jgi:hypothetical protein